MFIVDTNDARMEYDIHCLVKAFYPHETVKIITPETLEAKRANSGEQVKMAVIFTQEGACLTIDGRKYNWKAQAAKADKKNFKNQFKLFLYRTLCGHTGRSLPWGSLTGIRPTKIAMGMLEKGVPENEILQFLQEAHAVSNEKARLSLEIAGRERVLLSGVHIIDGYSLYIGIPFCPTTCLYCSFTSYPICAFRDRADRYIDCLIKEMEYVAETCRDKVLDTVYIGGGTPTTLEPAQLNRLLGKLKELFDWEHVSEFTVEAGRADSITKDKLEVLRRHGVTRISINPQTMKQETLDLIGRRHTVGQVIEAYRMARKEGFDNINMDLILGLPGETEADVAATVGQVKELSPDSLTVHSLAVKRASGLLEWIDRNGIELLHNTDDTMHLAAKGAQEMGMKPYYLYRQKNMAGNFENVGYARPGKAGLYNVLIMEEKQTIMALGAGSISKLVMRDGNIERTDNVKDVDLYMERIEDMIGRKQALFAMEKP